MATKQNVENPHFEIMQNLMVKHKLLQKDIAEYIGTSQPNVARGIHNPGSKTYKKIAQMFIDKLKEDPGQFNFDIIKSQQLRDKDNGKVFAVILKTMQNLTQSVKDLQEGVQELKKDVEIVKDEIKKKGDGNP